MSQLTIHWFTNDLRLRDNPGLAAASANECWRCVYIHDQENPWPIQGAAAWWLHHSLCSLNSSLEDYDQKLHCLLGAPLDAFKNLYKQSPFTALYCARAYNPYEREQQRKISEWCRSNNIEFKRFAGNLLLEPDQVRNKAGSYFKVFTPFYNYYRQQNLREPVSPKKKKSTAPKAVFDAYEIEELNLLPNLTWADDFSRYWKPGESGATKALSRAIDSKVAHYADQRDFMAEDGTSQLSPHLRFGEISPALIWQQASQQLGSEKNEAFLRQLVWRDFSYHLLFHNPHMPTSCFNKKFDRFPWRTEKPKLKRWQLGKTGYPIVDAAMNELWHTGWMHNRARMIVASFLTKHLLQPWLEGAHWFWDTLVDADLANNTAGWQWTAGCGADAAPYFRVFNPITQGERFDPDGEYTRKWLPELKALPNKFLFHPWDAPVNILRDAGITLGVTYPKPMIEHAEGRKRALEAYKTYQG